MSMRDLISINRINTLHPKVRAVFTDFIEAIEAGENVTIRIVQGLRTFKEQAALFAKGPNFTKANAGQSYHNYGLAIDIGVLVAGAINWKYNYGKFQKYMPPGMIWGADWDHDGLTKAQGDKDEHLVDGDHYQCTMGHDWHMLLILYNTKHFIPGTMYVNI